MTFLVNNSLNTNSNQSGVNSNLEMALLDILQTKSYDESCKNEVNLLVKKMINKQASHNSNPHQLQFTEKKIDLMKEAQELQNKITQMNIALFLYECSNKKL